MAPRSGDRGPGGASGARRGASSTDLSRTTRRRARKETARPAPAPRAAVAERARLVASLGTDPRAADALFGAELGAVSRIAARREGTALGQEDLRQEGAIGLMSAIREFSLAGGGLREFEELAARRITEAIDAALREEAEIVEHDRRMVEDAAAYERAELSLGRELKRAPTTAELASRLRWAVDKVELVGDAVGRAREAHDEEIALYLDPEEDGTDSRGG